MKRKSLTVFGIILILFGLFAFCYPSFANFWNQRGADQEIEQYDTKVQSMTDSEIAKQFKLAWDYNKSLTGGSSVADPFASSGAPNFTGTEFEDFSMVQEGGMIGYVDIPKIDVYLPILYGSSNKTLENGAGLVYGTSLPVGGIGTHAVISAHTGLASRKYFTDLTEMEEGDLFYIHILGKDLTYRVDQIKVVLPSETDDLVISSSHDYVTLLTCTPFGINDHRLLVRGVRVKDSGTQADTKEQADALVIQQDSMTWAYIVLCIIVAVGAGAVICAIVSVFRK